MHFKVLQVEQVVPQPFVASLHAIQVVVLIKCEVSEQVLNLKFKFFKLN